MLAITLDELASELRAALRNASADDASAQMCAAVSRALRDRNFVERHLPDRAAGEPVREVLYQDPELGFCICGHVNEGAAESGPHDHGSSWAIYGQAEGETVMTDWRIVAGGADDTPTLVAPERVYTLTPGDAHFYGVGAVHSPKRDAPTRLVRVEGANLDHVQRSNIKAA